MNTPILTHDAAVSAFDSAGGPVTSTDSGVSFDWDEQHVVHVDAPADLEGAFDTEKFYKIPDVTVARPIKQPYLDDGELQIYKKPAEELQRAAWSFDNVPFTLDHPETGMVKDVDDIHGFWRNAHYDSENERLLEDLYVPTTDDDATSFVEEHTDVSVGFYNRTADSFDGNTGSLTDDDNVDGFQVDIYGNHIAGVKKGRCSSAHGCGLDDQPHGEVVDASTSFLTKQQMTETPTPEEGDRMRWHADVVVAHNPDDESGVMVEILDRDNNETGMVTTVDKENLFTAMRTDASDMYNQGTTVSWEGGDARGEIVDSKSDGCFNSRIDGDVEVCASEDEPVYLIEEDDGKTVAHKHGSLSVVSGSADSEHPSGIHVSEDGGWYGVAPSETADDEPKYELDNCNDVKDAWNLRGSGDYTIEQSTLEARIKRAADAHNCPTENKPWETTDTNMGDEFDIPDLSVDAIVEQNDAVEALKDERDDLQSTVDEINETVHEKVDGLENLTIELEEDDTACDALDELAMAADTAAAKAEEVEDLRDELSEYRAEERKEALDTLTELGADEDEWEDEDLETIEDEIDRREEVLDTVDSVSVKGHVETNTDDGDSTSTTDRSYGRGYSA